MKKKKRDARSETVPRAESEEKKTGRQGASNTRRAKSKRLAAHKASACGDVDTQKRRKRRAAAGCREERERKRSSPSGN